MVIIGHRGAPAHAPENTLASFRKALELNASIIEFDISLCRSGELVVIHDSRIDRTTNGRGYVSDYSLEELKIFDAGNGEKIPSLEEVMNFLEGCADINIELKGRETAAALDLFLEKYIRHSSWKSENILVSSFDHIELAKLKKLRPEIRIGALYGGVPLGYSNFALPLNAWSIHYNYEFLSRRMVEHAHAEGYKVYTYTVDIAEDRAKAKAMGVDGVFSNNPREM